MKVVFVMGPTASGKSAMALEWAERFGGAIVNCDSIQVFKSLNVGSAKPSAEDFKRVPHFLFDYLDEGQEMTAGEYRRDFLDLMERIKSQFPVIFVVGGTGFYFQAIEKGMYSVGAVDEVIQKQVELELSTEAGALRLYQELQDRDPESALKISVRDHYRLGRAIEILRKHGRPVSEIKKEFEKNLLPFPYPLLKIGIRATRQELEPRVQERVEHMLQQGLVHEVRNLLARGLGPWAPLKSVGYQETVCFLQDEIKSEEDLKALIIQNTLGLAKKQRTWFRRDPEIFWIEMSQGARGQSQIASFLARN